MSRNILTSYPLNDLPPLSAIRQVEGRVKISEQYAVYLTDESRMPEGLARACSLPLEWILCCGRKDEGRLVRFRHALPEAVNAQIANIKKNHPQIYKLGTDFSVPAAKIGELIRLYHRTMEQNRLDYLFFGHIGDNHLHLNIIPHNQKQWLAGKAQYDKLADRVSNWGGSIAAEHGNGKIKVKYLSKMIGEKGCAEIRRLKRFFDPYAILNRGNVIKWNAEE